MKNILVIVDMQKDFVDGALGTAEAAGIVDAVCGKIKEFDGDIIVTLDTHGDNYMDTSEGKMLPVPHCIKGTCGYGLCKEVKSALSGKDYTCIEKPTFGSVELAKMLAEKYDMQKVNIELVGLCTDICVISNALLLKAFFPETPISVDSGCCAGVTPEKHEAALEAMRSCQINVK